MTSYYFFIIMYMQNIVIVIIYMQTIVIVIIYVHNIILIWPTSFICLFKSYSMVIINTCIYK